MLRAIAGSGKGRVVALASRDAKRARELAARHGVERVVPTYEDVLSDDQVEAVYIPLVNSLHREWTCKALQAGKHVLCEKPLAMTADEAAEMTAAARHAGRLLMEAFMYRFHPLISELPMLVAGSRYLHISFAYPLSNPADPRLRPELGGGALMDVGCYCVSLARLLLGEPVAARAVMNLGETGVDMSVSGALSFEGGQQATVFASFETVQYQELLIVTDERTIRVERPFLPQPLVHDSYRRMVDAFADGVLRGGPAPVPPDDAIANMRVIDLLRSDALQRRVPSEPERRMQQS